MSTYGAIKYTGFQDSGVVVGNTAYTNTSDLPTSGLEIGEVSFVSETSKMYMWTGSSWFNIAIANQAPTAISGNVASYDLAQDGTATTVTLTSTDPEGLPLTWSSSVSGVTQAATVTNVDNVFTITPSTNQSHVGTINVTFSVTDGNNTETSLSSFILRFLVLNSQYTSTLVEATGTGTNLTFVDASTQTHTITNTDVVAGTFSPYRSGGYSTYFDGSSLISAATPAAIGSQDYTIEFWMNSPNVTSTWQSLVSRDYSNSDGFRLYKKASTSELAFYSGGTAVRATTSGSGLTNNVWHHIAVVRNSGTLQIYVDGVSKASASNSDDISEAAAPINIGGNTGESSSYPFTGYIRDMRVVNGTAVYTSNFTPPTEPLTAITNTQLLTCHLPYIADGSTNAHAITVTGTVSTKPLTPFNNIEYSEALHGSSGYFGGNVDYLSIANDASYKPIANEDYTIESWVYLTATPSAQGAQIIGIGEYGTNSDWVVAATSSLGVNHYINPNINLNSAAGVIGLNSWNHIVVSRSGTSTNNTKMFINGKLVVQGTNNSTLVSTGSNLTLGGDANGDESVFTGYISDARIVKGTAVYTAAFTPPTAPLTAVTNTGILMNPNPNIVDKAQKSNITLVGDTTGSNTQQLFSSSTVKFDGTGDYLVVSSSSTDYGYGTGDFTIELWVYFNSVTATQTVVSNLTSVSSTNPHLYLLNTDSKIKYYDGGGDRITSSALSANTWYHVALSRASGSTKLFIDGTQSGSTYTDSNNYGTTAPFVVGTYYSGGSLVTTTPLNGYVQDVRVTNGLARYTNSFTPPTTFLLG